MAEAARWEELANSTLLSPQFSANGSLASRTRMHRTVALAFYALHSAEGDFVEAGTAQGGTSAAMMHVLDAARSQKRMWAFDSFRGLPSGSSKDFNCTMAQRQASGAHSCGLRFIRTPDGYKGRLPWSRRQFDETLARARVSLERLVVVPGWFHASMRAALEGRAYDSAGRSAQLERIAFLRVDGDLYTSTRDALGALGRLVAPGGIVYVDDYGGFGGCRHAVDEFRAQHATHAATPLHKVWEPFPRRRGKGGTTYDYAGLAFEAVWWQMPRERGKCNQSEFKSEDC